MIKVDIGVEKLDYIYHISDIHIRNFKRHEEYRRVFEKVSKYIHNSNRPNSVVIVTGDIVHSKTDVTPELVREVTWFLKKMSETHHVIVTTGNHDANLNNPDRLDALSPIVSAIDSNRIHYLKDGGVYEFGGVSFCVWSVFDKPKDYIKANQYESDFKIATYHGPVVGAKTETNFVLSHSTISAKDFDGYDLVLLGDIHKLQYLNSEETIAYPGSLVQQNHAELLDHGLLVWDLKNKKSEYVSIHNDTGFYTVDVHSGTYDLSSIPKNLSKLYLRIRHYNTSPSDIKKLISKVKETYEVIEVSNQKIKDDTKNTIEFSNRHNNIDTRDIEYQNKMISEYLKERYKLTNKEISGVLEINKKINGSISKPEANRNSIWSPKSFEFDNMFSYGKDNSVDFSKMEGTYGLFAANASGKSTLLDSIAFCLFDKCSKTFKGSQVINNQSDSFSCSLTFEINSKEYTISRSAIRQKSGNVRVDVDFSYKDEDGNKVSLNGKERADTNSSIRKVIGSYEDFVLTTLSTQNGGVNFIDMNQKDRKELLSQFLDINVFEELYTLANNEQKEILTLVKEYNKKNYQEELVKYEKIVTECDSEISKHIDTKYELDQVISKKTEELLELSSLITNSQEIDLDVEDLNNKKELVIKNLSDLDTKLKSANLEYASASLEYNNIQTQLQSYISDKDIKDGLDKLEIVSKNREVASIKVVKLQTEVKSKKEKIDNLSELKYNPNCKYCMDNVFIKDALIASSSFYDSQIELQNNISNLEIINSELSGSLQYKTIKEEKSKLSTSLALSEKKMNESSMQITKIEAKIKDNNSYLAKIEEQISSYKKNEEAIANDRKIKSSISDIKEFVETVKQKHSNISQKITELMSEKKLAQSKKKSYEEIAQNVKELEAQSKSYEYYLNSVHRDGVPHSIIKSVLPKIETEVNDILSQLVDFRVVFDTDDKNVNAYIVYDESRFWPIELSSGMEKFVSSMAIRNALISVSTLPRPNFMAIDEGFGVLSSDNLSSMPILFDYLKNQFKFILMVSHIDTMRDYVDSHIEIHKVNGRSSVRY